VAVTVFIVDDQAPFREAARTVVELTDGFEFAGEAEDGESAVEAARTLKPDLVLMDVNLPGMDGLETTRRILEESGGRVVVVVVSTYEAEEYAPRALEAGAAAYIPKSEFEPDRLAEAWASATT
jgi:DNA-binding NarL/FixJ family response regulator